MSKNRTQYIWKYLHVKTKLVFNSPSISFNNFIDSLANGENSSVHHINRYQFQFSLDSSKKGGKIFLGYLLIQSILTQLPLDNMKDIFDRVQVWRLLVGMVNFRAPTSSQPDLTFTLFCEGSPSCMKSFPLGLALFLNMPAKCLRTNEENFSEFIPPWYCSTAITPFPYEIAAIKWATLPPVPFRDFLSNETEIKSLSRLSPGHSSWSSDLVKRVHLMSKTCSIQIEFYTLLPKVCWKFTTNFSSKLKPQFLVIFGWDSFLLSTSPFQASLFQNSTNCLLTGWWWNVCFYHYSFLHKSLASLLLRAWFVVISLSSNR